MTNNHQQEEIQDSTAQKEPTVAGFASARDEREEQDGDRKEPTLGTPLSAEELGAGPIFTPPVEEKASEAVVEEVPTYAGFGPLDGVEPLAGSPVNEPAAEAAVDPLQALRRELAAAWGQDDVDNDAFEQVKHLTILVPASDEAPLVVVDPVSDDQVMLGTRADGVQAVLGTINVTAAQALNRAQLAMTSERFKAEGIEEIHGTEMDKALLAIAAHHVGLTIVNKPKVSLEVMAEAQAQWDALMAAKAAPAAEAAVAAAPVVEEAVAVAPVAEAPVEKAVAAAAAIDMHEIAHSADAALPLIEVEELPNDTIPVLTDVVVDLPVALKPEVQEILSIGNPIAPELYVQLRDRLKSGTDTSLADKDGFLLVDAFREHCGTEDRTKRMLEALSLDHVTYNAECITKQPRTVINHQVKARMALRHE